MYHLSESGGVKKLGERLSEILMNQKRSGMKSWLERVRKSDHIINLKSSMFDRVDPTKKHLNDTLLSRLPSSEMYYRSYLHSENVQFVAASPSNDFFLSLSVDGSVKFWHRIDSDLEFVKKINPHDGPFHSFSVSPDGNLLSTGSLNGRISVFQIPSFDLLSKFDFKNGAEVTVSFLSNEFIPINQLSFSFSNESEIHIIDALEKLSNDETIPTILRTLKNLHHSSITSIQFIEILHCSISCDSEGLIEFWKSDGSIPTFEYEFKTDTDFFILATNSLKAISCSVSKDGNYFAICCSDWAIRVFHIPTGKLKLTIPDDLTTENNFSLESEEVSLRFITERQFRQSNSYFSVTFDDSSSILLVPSIFGLKFISVNSGVVLRIIGRVEKHERFNSVALLQSGIPMVILTAFERQRIYLFTEKSPESAKRDVFNEKASQERLITPVKHRKQTVMKWPLLATLHTAMGSIKFRMFVEECPLAVENFVTLARRGYFDGIRIHRVVRDFCVQTGDPTGSGYGGESAWGGTFEDEFPIGGHKFDRPGMIGMANSGRNTNASQFFITTIATPHLNGKHTCWGEVVEGMENIKKIELVPVDNYKHPITEIKLINITFN
jgi:peptidylprolyl isomerase domain and WD repeat-containing protein 1